MLKRILIIALFLGSPTSFAAEPWKGKTQVPPVELGILTGVSFYGSSLPWSVLGTGAVMIDENGFADDIDDRLWIELEVGPAFFSRGGSSTTALHANAHLRWDFSYNEHWMFYGLGGLGAFALPSSMGGDFSLAPRFGVGVEYQTKSVLVLRGEVTSTFLGLGVAFNF